MTDLDYIISSGKNFVFACSTLLVFTINHNYRRSGTWGCGVGSILYWRKYHISVSKHWLDWPVTRTQHSPGHTLVAPDEIQVTAWHPTEGERWCWCVGSQILSLSYLSYPAQLCTALLCSALLCTDIEWKHGGVTNELLVLADRHCLPSVLTLELYWLLLMLPPPSMPHSVII